VASTRMRRLWAPFRVASTSIAAAAVARVNLTTLVDTTQGRSVRQYTVTRILLQFSCAVDSQDLNVFGIGIRFDNENVALGSVNPLSDTTADWMYHEEIQPSVLTFEMRDRVIRDIRAQRKSRGNDMDLFLYVESNTSVAGDFITAGRVLLLIP